MSPPAAEAAAPSRRADIVIAVCGWSLLGAFVAVAAWLGDIAAGVHVFQVAYALGFVGYGLLVFAVCRGRPAGCWSIWLVGCLLVRLVLVQTAPSDDLHRYLWEGRIQLAGYNPYGAAPDDPSLRALRDENWSGINHPEYTAIYPPLAEFLFLIVARIHPTLLAVKAVAVAFDWAAVVMLAAVLRAMGKQPHRAILYGLCPLTLTAVAIEGHVDGVMLAFLAAALWMDVQDRPCLCAVLIASAALTKIVPIVLLAWLWRRHRGAALLAAGLIVAAYIPYAGAGAGLFRSLLRFSAGTQLLGSGHAVLAALLGTESARWLGGAAVVGLAVVQAWRRVPLARYMLSLFGATIVLMPVVHYWYVTWVLVVVPVVRRVSWMVLAASMVFYFQAVRGRATGGVWAMPPAATYLVYVPFVAAWLIEAWALRRSGQRTGSGMSTDLW